MIGTVSKVIRALKKLPKGAHVGIDLAGRSIKPSGKIVSISHIVAKKGMDKPYVQFLVKPGK